MIPFGVMSIQWVGLKLLDCKLGFLVKTSIFVTHKMEVNYSALRMVELKAPVRGGGLWGYSRLRRTGLISLL